ncbi:HAD family hydrolase [Patescibacteria group bacterium]
MKILFDFDDVLFNTGDFVRDLVIIFGENGILEKEHKYFCDRYYKQDCVYGNACFNLERYLEFLNKKGIENIETIRAQCDDMFCDLSKYIFEDALEFLKNNKGHSLGILTFGDDDFQKIKITQSGIENFFDDISIVQGKKSDVLKKIGIEFSDTFFLDDRFENLEDVKGRFSEVKTILVDRPEGRYNDVVGECCDYSIGNFSELDDILNEK